jgi:hypothetical protein
VLVGAVMALILLRTTAKPLLGGLIHWDVLLPTVVYFGQRRTLPEGLILTLFCSHLFSLSSAAPIGVFTSYYLTIFMIARLVSYVMAATTWISIFLLLFSLSVLSRFILTGVSSAFGHGWPVFAPGNLSFTAIALGSILGYLVFQFLAVLDVVTYKTATSNIELAETGL